MKNNNLPIKCIFTITILMIISSCIKTGEKSMDKNMIVSFPLEGIYISPNTPGSNIPSHGTNSFGETYAIDFVMITGNDRLNKSYRKSFLEYIFKGLQLEDFYGWGQTVYSPVSGEVVGFENNIEERNPVNILNDYRNTIKVTQQYMDGGASPKIITGNYIMIKVSENKFA